MKKIIIIFIILAGVGVALFFILRPAPQTIPPTGNDFPLVPPPLPPLLPDQNQKTFFIKTPSGNVEVDNFLKDITPATNFLFYIESTPDYTIQYDALDESFTISVHGFSLPETRKEAEIKLLQILDTTPTNMCKLNIFVFVPGSVEPTLAGKDFNLSFCPDGIPF